MYMGSTIVTCRPRGCVSGARGKCMWRDVARSAFDGPKAALSRRQTSRCRRISTGVRADVNWDAFGPQARTPGNPPAAAMTNPAAPVHQFDFVVIGSGIAGLTYALKVAAHGRVAVITKEKAKEGCTQYAQGGVCAVLDNMDSVESHMEDTMVAGRHLNDPSAVRAVCQEGPARVLELVSMGAEFDRNDDGSLHLTREGGHSNRRIVHAADVTGKEIERALLNEARANANIHFFEHHLAVDLVLDDVRGVRHCFGVDVLDQHSDQMVRFVGLSTMLASGGAGQVYPNTTNPSVTTGDGIAMAFRSCAQVANMEFVQFHPTSLYDPTSTQGRSFLISEAVRGEGGLLYNKGGERFMLRYHDRAELAPRDTVARAIHQELMEWGEPHVLLDISHKPSDSVLQHFPNISQKCLELGIDITKDPIPVLPAQHYLCGGVQTGLLGETSVQGLYACGEVACTGLHGANRLASNSLLEGLVFAHRAVDASVAHAEHALRNCGRQLHYAAATADFSGPRSCKRLTPTLRAWVQRQRQLVNTVMWDHCGIIRRVHGLQQALNTIATIYVETRAVVKHYGVSTELQELLNVVTCAELIVSSALQRRESRGLHFCVDYPTSMEHQAQATVISSSLKKRFDLTPFKVGLASSDVSSFISLGKPPPARRLTVRSLNEPEE